MKKEIKKLSLKKETIATLNNKAMSHVLGGQQSGGASETEDHRIGGERTKTSQIAAYGTVHQTHPTVATLV